MLYIVIYCHICMKMYICYILVYDILSIKVILAHGRRTSYASRLVSRTYIPTWPSSMLIYCGQPLYISTCKMKMWSLVQLYKL